MRTLDELAADLGKIEDADLRTHIHRTWSFAEIYCYRHSCLAGGNALDFSFHQVPVFSTPKAKSLVVTFDLELTACLFALGKIGKMDAHTMAKTPAELQAEAKTHFDISTILEKIHSTTGETRVGVAALVHHLPDATRPKTIIWKEAVAILERLGGNATERTIRDWIKSGAAVKTGTPISWDDLKSVKTWTAWCETYVTAFRYRITSRDFISEHAGQVAQERTRRRK